MNGICINTTDGRLSVSLIGSNKALDLNENEAMLASMIIETLVNEGVNSDRLDIVRKSNDYATVVYHGCEWDSDLARFKFTERAKWVSVPIPNSKIEQLNNNPIFSAQKNKKQLLWKSKISAIEDSVILAKIASEYLFEVQEKFSEYR
ncbi:hypothetical protein [Adlercreutzia caecimuris]|uniref:hypothetical protein n=1 Tax=Adlercreutzia caecimuris TaxID=671266 RepID=UPI001C3C4007|nr:hypothetical protein [Adlercreutzia caecimuris]